VLPKLHLRTFYPGKVIAASGDEVTVLVDDRMVAGKWKGLDRVAMVFGMPGVTAIPLTGARVRVMFDAGDPSRPRAALWDAGAPVAELKLGGPAAVSVALAPLVHSLVSAALAAGAAAGGPGAANFTAAKSAWDASFVLPLTGVGAVIVKAV
jgi:hypothetical protein